MKRTLETNKTADAGAAHKRNAGVGATNADDPLLDRLAEVLAAHGMKKRLLFAQFVNEVRLAAIVSGLGKEEIDGKDLTGNSALI